MKIAYPALFEPQSEAGYTVTFPDLPEAITEGNTLEQARFNAAECLSFKQLKRAAAALGKRLVLLFEG